MAITRTDFNNAFREVIAQEFSNIPKDENSIDFTFSEKFERQMQRLIRSQRKIFYSFVNTSYKRVATVLVVLLTTAVTLFSIKPIRDPAFNFLGGIYNSLNQNSFEDNTPDIPSSNPDINQESKQYRLIYATEDLLIFDSLSSSSSLGEIKKGSDLVSSYLKKVVSQFEGQDVYFRVKVSPVVFYEEAQEEEYTKEKGEELKNQRIEYVKELGAMDMVLVPDITHSYYATVNAEMIKKIEQKGECCLRLASIPRMDGYNIKIADLLTYYLENMKDSETVAIKFSIDCISGVETVDELFYKYKITDKQITFKEYREEKVWIVDHYENCKYTMIEGSFTKEQIISLAEETNSSTINPLEKDDIVSVNVTEDTKLPI